MSESTRKLHRRWPRYSLRFLLLLVAVLAMPLAWKVNRVRNQRLVVAEVLRLKGQIEYDYEYNSPLAQKSNRPKGPAGPQWLRGFLGDDFFAEVVSIPGFRTEISDQILSRIATLPRLQQLGFSSRQITEDGFAYLASLHTLEILFISSDQVTDEWLRHLAKLHSLQRLDIHSQKITAVGLTHLTALPNLKALQINSVWCGDAALIPIAAMKRLESLQITSGRALTDDGLKQIARLDNLRQLSLKNVPFTDVGLAHLGRMTNLRSLSFNGSRATIDGVTRVHKALPKCQLRWNP